jgi:hypothetical protein
MAPTPGIETPLTHDEPDAPDAGDGVEGVRGRCLAAQRARSTNLRMSSLDSGVSTLEFSTASRWFRSSM